MELPRNMCRVCLNVESSVSLINWNRSIEDLNESLSYAECFQLCTQLNLNYENCGNENAMRIYENFCYNCASKLKEAYEFITQARESDNALRINCRNSDSDNHKKFFEWVAVGKEHTKVDKRREMEEEPISLGSNTGFDEDTNSQGYVQIEHKEISHESEVLNSSKPILSGISKIILSKPNRRKKSKTKTGMETNTEEICGICGKSMNNKKLLRHSCNRNIEYFLCKSCPRTFRHRSTLIQHELIHESNRERKFACGVCGRQFYTQMARRNHLKTHDPGREPRFHCGDCGQSFLFKGNLLVHQQKHAGKTIQCTYCQKRYVRAVDLEVHLRSHTGDTPFKCDKCEKAFTKRSTLRKHLQLHEGIQWKCEDCGKQYLYEWTLQRHRLEHTGLPLKCSICSKEFPEMYKIRRHIKSVHKINLTDLENFVVRLKERKKRSNISLNSLDAEREATIIQ
ncbi:zinc finger protein OZF-like isoform X1 [Zeugodacus cucurbitae]|uniref:zinc finger protein OZF-like isoform X1 n=1 Tax=Zeugodacus cucurbitae TaxID=28588 RepID=UPI0005967D19|nr:zinc finger protein OZF-like isoform X1 [Zeugodacus cucurbitae]XP_054087935.1 zinc finger protein OZF-like isoform X1 [Zeugodacus cucurbitae]